MRKVCPTLTFEAASKQTKPMLKSTVSPMRWLSMIQAYVLHYRIREEDVKYRQELRKDTKAAFALLKNVI